MGWTWLVGDRDDPGVTLRSSFSEVLLLPKLRAKLVELNRLDDGAEWLDDARVSQAVSQLKRIAAPKLIEANQEAMDLLIGGATVDGLSEVDGGRSKVVKFIDFENPGNNDFLAVNQFRVDVPGTPRHILPDIVLFVNGIPLVVIEAKSPNCTEPFMEAMDQLLRYSNQREHVPEVEGVEKLFWYNAFMVATCWDRARAGTIGALPKHFLDWKDTSPVPSAEVADALGVASLSGQQTLVAGMLRPRHLLDIIYSFIVFKEGGGRTVKVVPRYQQFRAVHAAVTRMLAGDTKAKDGQHDRRGGIVWHTQGSGKSLTMVFLIRKMRTVPELRKFKVVAVTDRRDLEKQLAATAMLTGETILRAKKTDELRTLLAASAPDIVFATIQKMQNREGELEGQDDSSEREEFPVLNESESIVVIIDEAHRSHGSALHANLMRALPNAARIGLTGTPIMMGDKKRTTEIFGDYIDTYTIQQAQADGATVEIVYEGRNVQGAVADGASLDEVFEQVFAEHTDAEREAIKKKWGTRGNVRSANALIDATARDIFMRYVGFILPNGFKGMVVANSRLAAVRYQEALGKARDQLVAELEAVDEAILAASEEEMATKAQYTQFLVRSHKHIDLLRRLEFAAVISGDHNDEPMYREWTDKAKTEDRIERFANKPLVDEERPERQDNLAFLCVKSMLLTGFDAPLLQGLYLDRPLKEAELLQAIARVNRTADNKSVGYVVDYSAIADDLYAALAVYSEEDVAGALVNIREELPILQDRHQRVLQLFHERGIDDIQDDEACVDLLRDEKLRAEFVVKLKEFVTTFDVVMPHPEALRFVGDAKLFGWINQRARNKYRDEQLNLYGVGPKVRQLIDDHIMALGVDPKIPPISILDAGFENHVNAEKSQERMAAEMEHAARHHIQKHMDEDPVRYQALSERLEGILQSYTDDWDALVAKLHDLTGDIRSGRGDNEAGLDDDHAPYYDLLAKTADTNGFNEEQLQAALRDLAIEVVGHVEQEVGHADFWSRGPLQAQLNKWLIEVLDDSRLFEFEAQPPLAEELMNLTRARYRK